MKTRTGVAVLVVVPLALGLGACGSSSTTTASVAAAASTTTSSTTTTTTPPAKQKKKIAPVTPKKKKSPSHAQTTTTTTTSSTTTTTSSTTATTTTHPTTTTTHTTPAIAPLPGPVVSGSSGGAKVTFHGPNHSPKIGVKWQYMVEATNSKGQALSGTVLTEFALGGTVVGKEAPPTHKLTDGVLTNKITFPPASKGIALTVHVVVTTSLGTVTLDWPVKSVT